MVFVHRNIKARAITTVNKIFIVLGALKSLLCFPLGIDVNDTLNYRTNYC